MNAVEIGVVMIDDDGTEVAMLNCKKNGQENEC